jgi:hypothetical protein
VQRICFASLTQKKGTGKKHTHMCCIARHSLHSEFLFFFSQIVKMFFSEMKHVQRMKLQFCRLFLVGGGGGNDKAEEDLDAWRSVRPHVSVFLAINLDFFRLIEAQKGQFSAGDSQKIHSNHTSTHFL